MNRKKYATNCRRTSSIMAHNYGAMGNGSPFESDALSGSTVSSSPLPQYSYVHVRVSVYVPLCLYTSMSMVERAVFAHRYNVRLSERKKKPWGRTLNVGLHHPSPYISEHVCGSIRPAQYQSDTLQTVRRCTECTFRFPAVSFFSPPLVDDGGERDMELGGYVLFVS